MNSKFIQISVDKFNEFILECLPKHHASDSLLNELGFRSFHALDSFKKNFINDILENYYGIHFSGTETINNNLYYKLLVTDKKLCTFFLLKYGG